MSNKVECIIKFQKITNTDGMMCFKEKDIYELKIKKGKIYLIKDNILIDYEKIKRYFKSVKN